VALRLGGPTRASVRLPPRAPAARKATIGSTAMSVPGVDSQPPQPHIRTTLDAQPHTRAAHWCSPVYNPVRMPTVCKALGVDVAPQGEDVEWPCAARRNTA